MANSTVLPDTHLAVPDALTREPSPGVKGWLFAAVAVTALGALAFRFAPTDSKTPYRAVPVVRRTVVRVVETTGHLDVTTRVEVPAPAPARVSHIFVKAGSTVSRGQPLVQLDEENAVVAALRTVRAPVDGTLLSVPRWSGQVVAPEQCPVAVIGSDLGTLRIDSSVAEADIGISLGRRP